MSVKKRNECVSLQRRLSLIFMQKKENEKYILRILCFLRVLMFSNVVLKLVQQFLHEIIVNAAPLTMSKIGSAIFT